MLTTEFNGKQYVFEDDRLTVNGIPLLYSEMSNIAHLGGEQPAFVFDYRGRRFKLPYDPAELRSILPYFLRAREIGAAPAPAPVEVPDPAPYVQEEVPVPAPDPYVQEEVPAPAPDPYVQEEVPVPTPDPYVQEVVPAPAPDPYVPEEVPAPDPYVQEEVPAPAPGPYVPEEVPAPAPDPGPYVPEEVPDPDPYVQEEVPAPDPDPYVPEEVPAPALFDQEEPPKKKLPVGKIIIGALILVALVVLAIFIFGGKSENGAPDDMSDADFTMEQDADEAIYDIDDTEDTEAPAPTGDAVEATDGFTVTDSDGSMDVKLKKVYTDDEALQKLQDMGEDQSNFSDASEPGYRLVVYEYDVQVKDGAMIGDTITGEMYMSDKKTEFDDWWPCDLLNNVDKDLSSGEINIPAGETSSVYIAYAMPKDLKDYYENVLVDENDTEIWVHYVLD